MKPFLAASLFVLCLTACGGPSEEDVLTPDKIRASESAPELPDVQLSENPEPPPAPALVVEQPSLNEVENGMMENEVVPVTNGPIPAAFQDNWGTSSADCQPGDVVGNGLLITSDSLMSSQSVGRLQEIVGSDPERFVGLFDYDGEAREEQLLLTGSSNILIRTAGGQRIAYRRCRAAGPSG